MVHGGCLCGEITYQVSGPLRPVIACHCRQCRKTSGHHVAATSAPVETITITGSPKWFRSSERAERGFCPVCGSNLFWRTPGHMSIFAGTLEDGHGAKLAGHIYCANKGEYYDITDDLPKADGYDPVMTTQVVD